MSKQCRTEPVRTQSDRVKPGDPLVSIGMPVFNGSKYLERAIQSILDQDYTNFELIIVDNASDDATEQIAQAFATSDDRVHYHRNEENIGAARNYNRALALATGPYFKWAAHDDWLEPGYLSACVAALEQDPDAVLAFPATNVYDEEGRYLRPFDFPPGLSSSRPSTRFHHSLWSFKSPAVFGVVRSDVLRRSMLIQEYKSSDRPLLSELVLAGSVVQIEAPLFNLTEAISARKGRTAANWWQPARQGASPPTIAFHRWRLLGEYGRLVLRSSGLGVRDRAIMVVSVTGFFARGWPRRALLKEARNGVAHLWQRIARTRPVQPTLEGVTRQ